MSDDRTAVATALAEMQRQLDILKGMFGKGEEPGLYVRRRLLPVSARAFREWFEGQGFKNVLPITELHVTVVYSRRTIPWQSLPSHVVISEAAGALLPWTRFVQPLGDGGAVVLRFNAPALQARWAFARDKGASWDHEGGYKPHVTISWDDAGVDLDKVAPFSGMLEFGPEVQQPINENWVAEMRAT